MGGALASFCALDLSVRAFDPSGCFFCYMAMIYPQLLGLLVHTWDIMNHISLEPRH